MNSYKAWIFAVAILLWTVSAIKLNHEGKPSSSDDDQFEEFKRKYNRQYSGKEYGERKAAFARTLREIKAN